jgi:hypothetical protein
MKIPLKSIWTYIQLEIIIIPLSILFVIIVFPLLIYFGIYDIVDNIKTRRFWKGMGIRK